MIPRVMMDPFFCLLGLQAERDYMVFVPDRPHNSLLAVRDGGGVFNYKSRKMRLTRGKLLKGRDWTYCQESQWKQLDQYDKQGMFGEPV